jgi:hypothetical protein
MRISLHSEPARHWRSYGDDKLPTPAEALGDPFAAFPWWFMRIECDRCGGRAGKAELITGIEGASSMPVRKIVLRE